MAIINFTIPARLELNVKKAVRENGFASKAEFFRMAAVSYLKENSNVKDKIKFLEQAIAEELRIKYRGKKLPPVEDQLKDIFEYEKLDDKRGTSGLGIDKTPTANGS